MAALSSLLPSRSLKSRNVGYALFAFFSVAVLLVAGAGPGADDGAAGPAESSLHHSQFWIYTGVLLADKERCFNNLIISPFSILGMFRTLEMAAGGETLEQMRGFFNEETQRLTPPPLVPPAVFHFAERVYLNSNPQDHQLTEYKHRIAKVGGEVKALDFPDPEAARQDINAFVSEKTEGLIKELVSPGDLDSLPNFLAVNAAIFKAQWLDHFNTVFESVFFGIGPDHQRVEQRATFMQQTFRIDEIQYTHIEGRGTIIRLPFTDRKLGMYVMISDNYEEIATDLTAIHHRLDLLVGASMNGSSDQPDREVIVTIPKFNITPDSCKIDVIPAMEAVGITRLNLVPDFSRMTDRFDNLQLDMWIHKAGIEADENGVVATAASAGSIALISASLDEPIDLRLDRPFFFAVIYQPNIDSANPSDDAVLLFNGHLVNAEAAQVGLEPAGTLEVVHD
ncbi:serpin (serine proteinase inhibitor) superfamily protein [Cystoisospora suis]|uniref:Serpin (Serine proteinase inhibitor) superfamily protein n=1 Tax=Cystoisospora suis TaxID=483139 RepID=A0A2C6L5Z6_9APIC|nr:serpin (serine proteinase inhibitor) superfamily protein [Cystoisospora suis]